MHASRMQCQDHTHQSFSTWFCIDTDSFNISVNPEKETNQFIFHISQLNNKRKQVATNRLSSMSMIACLHIT